MGFRIREFSRDYLLYPEFGKDKDRDDIAGGGGSVEREYDKTDETDYIWMVDNGEKTILFYKGASIKPEIPDTIDNKKVVALAATAFNYSNVEKVKMTNNIRIVD